MSEVLPSQSMRDRVLAKRAAEAKAAQEARDKAAAEREAAAIRYAAKADRFKQERDKILVQNQQELVEHLKQNALFPVKLGNLLGPEGNVFNVIASVRHGIRWAEQQGILLPEQAYDIVRGYRQRKYDQTLDLITTFGYDIDDSVARLRDETFADMEIAHGDNPLGGFFGRN